MYSYRYCLNRSTCSEGFKDARNSSFFVDKSALIELVNSKIATKEKWICVSRPRRFGKTMALEMLTVTVLSTECDLLSFSGAVGAEPSVA